MDKISLEIRNIEKETLKFEIKNEDDFCIVLNRYMSEQGISVKATPHDSAGMKNKLCKRN